MILIVIVSQVSSTNLVSQISSSPIATLTRTEFRKLCAANPDRFLERSPQGELIIMAPTGGETGHHNFCIAGQLYVWSQTNGQGKAFDSSTGFELPSGGDRSPDVSWIPLDLSYFEGGLGGE